MVTLKPYPEYKNSGLSWLGKIPAHWRERRAKYFFREVDDRSDTGREELLSVSHVTGVSPRSQKNVTMFMAESYVGTSSVSLAISSLIQCGRGWLRLASRSKQGLLALPMQSIAPRDRTRCCPSLLTAYSERHLMRQSIHAVRQVFVPHGCGFIRRGFLISQLSVRHMRSRDKY
jgi:hypothetical protein